MGRDMVQPGWFYDSMLQQFHVILVLKIPELDTGLSVRSHQTEVEHHLAWPIPQDALDVGWDTVDLTLLSMGKKSLNVNHVKCKELWYHLADFQNNRKMKDRETEMT